MYKISVSERKPDKAQYQEGLSNIGNLPFWFLRVSSPATIEKILGE